MTTANRKRIEFMVEGRRFEGVDPRHDDEIYITIKEALRRTADENGGAIKGEDWRWLWERRNQLPLDLDWCWLVTNKRVPGRWSGGVSCFNRNNSHCGRWLADSFEFCFLVVRRLS